MSEQAGQPLFFRDVPLMPSEAEKGTIQPLDMAKLPLIAWRLRNVAEPRSRLLLTGMYTCAKMPLVVTTLSLMNIH